MTATKKERPATTFETKKSFNQVTLKLRRLGNFGLKFKSEEFV